MVTVTKNKILHFQDSGVEKDEVERGGTRRNYATDHEDDDDDTKPWLPRHHFQFKSICFIWFFYPIFTQLFDKGQLYISSTFL